MTPEMICQLVEKTIDDMQGIDIKKMDVRELTPIADYMIITSARSSRQMKAIAEEVIKQAKKSGLTGIRSEGNSSSEWVLVDLGSVVVHVMLASAREFYALEDLWDPVHILRQEKK